MFIVKLLGKLLKALSSGESPRQIADGFILGMILGLTPFWSLHNLVVILLVIILSVNISMAIFSWLIFSAFAYLLDPLFHSLGYWLLVDVTALRGLWTAMYNIPVVPLTRFNNTVVLGSFVSSLVLLVPIFFVVKRGVVLYREKIHDRVQKLKIVKIVKSSGIYSLYKKIKFYGD